MKDSLYKMNIFGFVKDSLILIVLILSQTCTLFTCNTNLLTGLVENPVPLSNLPPVLSAHPHPWDREHLDNTGF